MWKSKALYGNKCTIIRKTKHGLYIISLDSNSKQTESVAKRNIDLWVDDDQAFKQYLESDGFSQFVDSFTIALAKQQMIPLWMLTSHSKAHAMLFREQWRKRRSQKLIVYQPMNPCTQTHTTPNSQ